MTAKTPCAALLLAVALAGCSKPTASAAPPPAKAEPIAHESELLKLTLTPEAVARLGLATAPVEGGAATAEMRTVPGEIVAAAAPGGLPIAAATDFGALAAQQARSDADLARADADLRLALANLRRASELVQAEAGSVRARDEATAQVSAARAARRVAAEQRRLLGPAVARLGTGGALWVRAQAFAADLGRLDRDSAARVRPVDGGNAFTAGPVRGPATAAPGAASVDLYYALAAPAGFRLGQRVLVDLPIAGRATPAVGLSIPVAAILTDVNGGEWVYVETGARAYERRRVEVARIEGGRAILARGLAPGLHVVTAGAAELFGTEFGTK